MKYAIISDIHGNIYALRAALSDAGAQGADMFLFLGDYYRDCPWPNEVAEAVRRQKSAVAIRGNGEGYLIGLRQENREEWTHEQFKLAYWNCLTLSQENLDYLTALPETAVIADGDDRIQLSHAHPVFYRSPKIPHFHSSGFRAMMEAAPFSHAEYLRAAKEALLSRPDAVAEIEALPKGVYCFGHNHLQFHMEYEGRVFINPGSCGVALDLNTTAAYTVLERAGDGWSVTERRVEYAHNAVADGIRRSGLAAYTPAWGRIAERQILTGKDHMTPFLRHVMEVGRQHGQVTMPVGNAVWDAAVKSWDADII